MPNFLNNLDSFKITSLPPINEDIATLDSKFNKLKILKFNNGAIFVVINVP